MPTRDLQPEGMQLIVDAVHRIDDAKARLAEAEKAVEEARAEVAQANADLNALVAHGQCGSECEPAAQRQAAPPKEPPVDTGPSLDDESVKIVWRIAFQLWRDPVLDYQYVARMIWGELDKTKAKNRVNAHVTQLRKDNIVKTLGGNRFELDVDRFREKCPVPVPERRPGKAA